MLLFEPKISKIAGPDTKYSAATLRSIISHKVLRAKGSKLRIDHPPSRAPRYSRATINSGKGFALVEILIAVAILSMVLLSVISGVSSSIYVISGMKNQTQAVLLARTKMNDFILHDLRGTDIKREEVREFPGFAYTRTTRPFEHPWFQGPVPMNITEITINWKEKEREREYKISYIYQTQ